MLHPGFILAIALALVHGFGNKLPIFKIIPKFRWTSFAGGVSLAYVFLEIFPELSHIQEEIHHSDIILLQFLENHVYIMALIGLIFFYGLDLFALKKLSHQVSNSELAHDNPIIFWFHISAYGILNFILGYLMQDISEHTLIDCILFFITAALHFFIIDEHLRENQKSLYDKQGRWLLVSAIFCGAIMGQVTYFEEVIVGLVWSFLAGSLILNVLKRELPNEKDTCFGSLMGGSLLFTVLLLLM